MAILIRGMECLLCGKPIGSDDEVTLTPAFVVNLADPMVDLSDAAYHRACFEKHPLAKQATRLLAELGEARVIWPPLCFICGERVDTYDDLFTFGWLTDDPASPLAKYRFKGAHENCLERLDDLPELYEALRRNLESGVWTGPAVEQLMSEIGRAIERRSAPEPPGR